ncbi:MAG: hypothetical protein KC503_02675 [Myxococcales bacterium]|nr:hypothetical protein [Myxococcales bacterium]
MASRIIGAALALVVIVTVGCDGRQVSAEDGAIKDSSGKDSSGKDSSVKDSAGDGTPRDAPAADLVQDTTPADAQRDAPPSDLLATDGPPGPCGCKPGEVWIKSSCAPTLELGCAPRCSGSCTKSGYTCDQCGAQPDCTQPSASICAPACVPSQTSPSTPLPDPLRISPVSGPAGQQNQIAIEGAPFYIGALFYLIRVNGGSGTMDIPASKPCTTVLRFTPPSPGVYTIEVSQYGGGTPWVLAGFFTATAGASPTGDVQPGFACGPSDTCHSGPGKTCSCQAGRCRCQ